MATVRKIEQKMPEMIKRKRVAAYARVSVEMEQPMKSLSAQVSHYSSLIQNNPEWEYAGVYADAGISGTSTVGREKFNELIRDCEDGKIDIVLAKSISRFARNTVDLLNTIRHLKEIGVEVRFERENISTFSSDGEMVLTLLASFAQEESESISRNERWAIQKKFERGESNTTLRSFGYDWDFETGTCVINENEAVWVRYIYKRYLDGASIKQIAKDMAEKGVCGLRGEPLSRTTIRRILTSELYVGDMILQRYYSPQVRKPKVNNGEVPRYLVSDAHQAIISREEFQAVQKRLRERAEECDNHGYIPHRFSGMVRCGKCGYLCCHVERRKTSARIECAKYKTGECDLLPIRESELSEACEKVSTAHDRPKQIVLFDDHIDFAMKSGAIKTLPRNYPEGWYNCFSGKIICSGCGHTFVRVSKKNRDYVIWTCNTRKCNRNACDIQSIHEKELVMAAKELLGTEDYKIKFYSEIKKVMVYNDRLDFKFKEGNVKTWKRK